MENKYISERLAGIQKILVAAHSASHKLSAATKGRERELLIDLFLSKVLPPTIRFGCGEVTDRYGEKSGQLDLVIESPQLPVPSFPIPGVESSRLYIAEGVAAAIEVKSDIKNQWEEIENTANSLAKLRRDTHALAACRRGN